MPSGLRVAPLAESQIEAAGRVLAGAFAADPLARYLFPEGAGRERLLDWHYTALVRYGWLGGEVYVAAPAGPEPSIAGAAVWLPSEGPAEADPALRLERLERAGLLQAPAVLGDAAFGRLAGVVGHLEGRRRKAVPGAHWYLNQVGVDPRWRGQGAGAALLRPVLERAGAAGWPVYLETFWEPNLAFYRRLGFAVLAQDVEPGSGLPYWACLRH
jgi:GNAT superfamily N-acetyltransferase